MRAARSSSAVTTTPPIETVIFRKPLAVGVPVSAIRTRERSTICLACSGPVFGSSTTIEMPPYQRVAFLLIRIVSPTTIAVLRRLRFLLALGPALLHHLRDTLAGSRAHVAAWPLGSSMTATRSSTTASRAKPFQGGDGPIYALTFSLKVT